MKTLFEQMGGTYTIQGDFRLPNLTLPTEETRPIGVCEYSAKVEHPDRFELNSTTAQIEQSNRRN